MMQKERKVGLKKTSRKDSKAQVALEFVLISGAILLMGVLVFPFITRQITLNKANAAARDGAVSAVNMFNTGYTVTLPPYGEISGPIKPMRLRETNLVFNETVSDVDRFQIQLVIDFPDDETTVNKDRLKQVIGAQAMRHVNYAFSGTWPSFDGNATTSTVQTAGMEFSFGSITWQ